MILEDADGAPFAGEDKVGKGIVIEVGKSGAIDGADGLEGVGVAFIQEQAIGVLAEDAIWGGVGVAAGDGPAGGEKVEVAVVIDIGNGQGASGTEGAEVFPPQRIVFPKEEVEGWWIGFSIFVSIFAKDEAGGSVGTGPAGKARIIILGGWEVIGFSGPVEICLVHESGWCTAATGTDYDIVEFILVEVPDSHAGAHLAEASGEQGLLLEVIERGLVMLMSELAAAIDKPGFGGGGARVGGGLGLILADHVEAIGAGLGDTGE